jgi:DNA-binding response OmpR family regulator
MKHIILVEDDEAIKDVFEIVFGKGDYKLVTIENGNQIIDCEMEAPDLFILDKRISGTNGLDVCRFIRSSEKYKKVPVIMLSASPDIAILAKDAGADDAIAKPFSLKKLRETVSKYVL